ncbi:hypothetical protein INT08_10505 [Prosthecochloris sp. N3]|uniref:Uncharacterized protein n=1 Tax=Prosthecochloris ethylica TaxID=2743976 RepID=A0ABR9XUC9_9CHLB|nr:hypothetical protein [Prosthecochloris ethylica]MBF0587374.1 hypothetical protein [Prosthecochloris ethylica]MBF0637599.1 hypothetical protein [Prosthecochloris ethylica]NUK48501.1 hypothetical protein [Prosthecochloris ethylica]
MSIPQNDISRPDKYDLLLQKMDRFQELVDQKNQLQEKIASIQQEYQERVRPLEEELETVIRKLDQNLAKLDTVPEEPPQAKKGYTRYGRGQLGVAIKELLRSNPDKRFKPKEIADALNTKGTSVSLWFNKYGIRDEEIRRIPVGRGGKRFLYTIRENG